MENLCFLLTDNVFNLYGVKWDWNTCRTHFSVSTRKSRKLSPPTASLILFRHLLEVHSIRLSTKVVGTLCLFKGSVFVMVLVECERNVCFSTSRSELAVSKVRLCCPGYLTKLSLIIIEWAQMGSHGRARSMQYVPKKFLIINSNPVMARNVLYLKYLSGYGCALGCRDFSPRWQLYLMKAGEVWSILGYKW